LLIICETLGRCGENVRANTTLSMGFFSTRSSAGDLVIPFASEIKAY
jgi:hypothetical protein